MKKATIWGIILTFLTTTVLPVFTPNALAADNLIPNPSVEISTNATAPDNWNQGYIWGDLDANYQYLSTGYQSNRSTKVTVSRYVSGDAKWYFDSQPVVGNRTYRYSDTYISTTPTYVVGMVTHESGLETYFELAPAAPAATWTHYSVNFVTPADAQKVTIFHLIRSVGSLTTDNFSLTAVNAAPTFERGLVSLSFDDGWQSIYTNSFRLLNKYQYKSTQYIVSGFVGTPDYMTAAQVKSFSDQGHEIASHSVHHYDLTTLSLRQLRDELTQSKAFLESLTHKPVKNFALPYGAYNTTVLSQVRQYYRSARSSDEGINTKANFNIYNIQAEYITPHTTLAQFQGWLAEAKQNKAWLVVMYHQVDTSGSDYSVTPTNLNLQLQAIQKSGLKVVTVDEALSELVPQL